MTLLFKVENPHDADNPVVGDTNFKKHNPTVNISMSWETLEPLIRQATEDYIFPFIGEEWYDEIAEYYDLDAVITDEEKTALQLLQDSIAWYAGMSAMQGLNVTTADMGIQQNSSKEGVSHPTTQWAYKDALRNALASADRKLERLLNYLEKNVSQFTTWSSSDAYNVKTSDFIRRTVQLDEILNIKKSRRSFVALSTWLKRAEYDHLLPILESTTFNTYATKIKAGTALTDLEKELVRLCRDVVAFKGLASAVPHLALSIEDDGFRVISHTDGFQDKRNTTNAQHLKLIDALRIDAEKKGETAISCLLAFLYKNKATFTDWADSDAYENMASVKSKEVIYSPNGRGGIML